VGIIQIWHLHRPAASRIDVAAIRNRSSVLVVVRGPRVPFTGAFVGFIHARRPREKEGPPSCDDERTVRVRKKLEAKRASELEGNPTKRETTRATTERSTSGAHRRVVGNSNKPRSHRAIERRSTAQAAAPAKALCPRRRSPPPPLLLLLLLLLLHCPVSGFSSQLLAVAINQNTPGAPAARQVRRVWPCILAGLVSVPFAGRRSLTFHEERSN